MTKQQCKKFHNNQLSLIGKSRFVNSPWSDLDAFEQSKDFRPKNDDTRNLRPQDDSRGGHGLGWIGFVKIQLNSLLNGMR